MADAPDYAHVVLVYESLAHGVASLTLTLEWKDFRTQARRAKDAGATLQQAKDLMILAFQEEKHIDREAGPTLAPLIAHYLLSQEAIQARPDLRQFSIRIMQQPQDAGRYHRFIAGAFYTMSDYTAYLNKLRAEDDFIVLRGR